MDIQDKRTDNIIKANEMRVTGFTNTGEANITVVRCLNCGQNIELSRKWKKFCNDFCRAEYHKKNRKQLERILMKFLEYLESHQSESNEVFVTMKEFLSGHIRSKRKEIQYGKQSNSPRAVV